MKKNWSGRASALAISVVCASFPIAAKAQNIDYTTSQYWNLNNNGFCCANLQGTVPYVGQTFNPNPGQNYLSNLKFMINDTASQGDTVNFKASVFHWNSALEAVSGQALWESSTQFYTDDVSSHAFNFNPNITLDDSLEYLFLLTDLGAQAVLPLAQVTQISTHKANFTMDLAIMIVIQIQLSEPLMALLPLSALI